MNWESSPIERCNWIILRRSSGHNATRDLCFVGNGMLATNAASTISFRKGCAGLPLSPIRGEQ
jgi:hypothetical protein